MKSKLMPKGRLRIGSFYLVIFVIFALILGILIGQVSFNLAVDYRLKQIESQISPCEVTDEPYTEDNAKVEQMFDTDSESLKTANRGSCEREFVSLGNFSISYYCKCEVCCGKSDGITATGTVVEEGRTIAVDPDVIPLGTQVMIDGILYTAEDVGGAIQGNKVDIYTDSHAYALQMGRYQAEVFICK